MKVWIIEDERALSKALSEQLRRLRPELVILLSIIGLYSCQKEIGTKENEQITEKSFNAQEEFSIILSKALHENINLREFLKNEALKHFDKDNAIC